jgi:hypothetical protein
LLLPAPADTHLVPSGISRSVIKKGGAFMGVATEVFRFHQLLWDETVGLFIHGYGDSEFADYAIVPTLASNVPSGAVQVQAQLTDDVTSRHVDGTVARTIWIQNRSVGPQPFISVRVIDFTESF